MGARPVPVLAGCLTPSRGSWQRMQYARELREMVAVLEGWSLQAPLRVRERQPVLFAAGGAAAPCVAGCRCSR
jgi:hypothetical protein